MSSKFVRFQNLLLTMKNLKIYFSGLLLIFCASTMRAQSAQADKIIKAAESKFNGLQDISAKFKYTLNNPNLKKPIVKEGKIDFAKNKYRIVFPDEEIYCNGRYVWIVLKEDEEITKSNFDPEEGLSPQKVFKVYQDTKSKYDGLEGSLHKITLFSNNDKSDIWKTEVWVDKSSSMVNKSKMYARNGSTYEYSMQSIKTNSGLGSGAFSYDEVKAEDNGWIVNDLTDD